MLQPEDIARALKQLRAEAMERHSRIDGFLAQGRTDLAMAEIRKAKASHVKKRRLNADEVIGAVNLFYCIAQEARLGNFVVVGGASRVLQGLKNTTKDVDIETNGTDFTRLDRYLRSRKGRSDGVYFGAALNRMYFHCGGFPYEVYRNEANAGRAYMNSDFTIGSLTVKIRRKEFLRSK